MFSHQVMIVSMSAIVIKRRNPSTSPIVMNSDVRNGIGANGARYEISTQIFHKKIDTKTQFLLTKKQIVSYPPLFI